MSAKKGENGNAVAVNRRARFDYEITDTFEAGLVLVGTEVKSLRDGKANIAESYVSPEKGEIWLINADIPPFSHGNRHNHEPRRPRKLLLHKKEMSKLFGAVQREGMTVIPLRLFFNDRGLAKLQIGLAKGKKTIDKRETKKERDWNRAKQRILKNFG
ncbi:SsrA-binding protein SmpB [Maricaulaceae bacterium EIL42A08]|nr:SsrA-binding protein SmpB [Maricaulaceae bacterium EIL42A08]MCP2679683.1 SsrA-binding protein SmpB [Maricaulaceae bacterium NA33B04]